MKLLRITGASGAGKTAALSALQKKYGGQIIEAPKSQARATRATVKALGPKVKRVYVDIQGRPTAALESYIIETCKALGVEYLTLAHN